jgi:hypothetical protein
MPQAVDLVRIVADRIGLTFFSSLISPEIPAAGRTTNGSASELDTEARK